MSLKCLFSFSLFPNIFLSNQHIVGGLYLEILLPDVVLTLLFCSVCRTCSVHIHTKCQEIYCVVLQSYEDITMCVFVWRRWICCVCGCVSKGHVGN